MGETVDLATARAQRAIAGPADPLALLRRDGDPRVEDLTDKVLDLAAWVPAVGVDLGAGRYRDMVRRLDELAGTLDAAADIAAVLAAEAGQ